MVAPMSLFISANVIIDYHKNVRKEISKNLIKYVLNDITKNSWYSPGEPYLGIVIKSFECPKMGRFDSNKDDKQSQCAHKFEAGEVF